MDTEEMCRVLCVDDEPNVLQGLERTLFEHFDVVTATSGAEGLEILAADGPFAVVVSDMQMPNMNGAKFLETVRERAPDTTRVLLTGHAALDSAIAAVNQSNIFRFLCKPCSADVLIKSLRAAAAQHRLVTSERELLNNTLNGAIKVLVDVLSLAAPTAFMRAGLVKSYVSHICATLSLEGAWQIEMAGMLSQLGCITLPPDTLKRILAGQEVSATEQGMFDSHPEAGAKLLASIPRLEGVAEIIRLQGPNASPAMSDETIDTGAAVLRVALAVDTLVTRGKSVRGAAKTLQRKASDNDKVLLRTLLEFSTAAQETVVRAMEISDLRCFMVLDEDVRFRNGNVVVKAGREINAPLIERLKNFARGVGIVEPIRVRINA